MPDEIDTSGMSPEEILELQKQNCIFCKIAEKQIPAKIIHEDDDIICVLDINPISEGHILVYPKNHYMIMPHVPKEITNKLFRTVKLMSQTLLRAMQCKGTTIFVANGGAAGQKAPHLLIHVFPRKEGDGLMQLPVKKVSPEEIKKVQVQLKAYITKMLGPSQTKPKQEITQSNNPEVIIEPPKNKIHNDLKQEILVETPKELEENDSEHESEDIESEETQDIEPENQDNESEVEKVKTNKKPEQKKVSKKSSSVQNNTSNNAASKKVDLNDIARLFGGR